VIRFATIETTPLNETTDTDIWVASPEVQVPDHVVVAISLNGQQFSKDFIIHNRDLPNTYEYISEMGITSYEPQSGPSIGGTVITIEGYSFTQLRNNEGETEMEKNHLWVRFVDPSSKEELTTPSEA
jgi:hypothetical protein